MTATAIHEPIAALWAAFRASKSPRDRDLLTRHYLPMVRVTVFRLAASAPSQVDRDDLIALANIALVKAIDGYESGRGATFETYSLTLIRGAVLDALRSSDPQGRARRRRLAAYAAAGATLEGEGKEPTPEAIAARLGVPADDVLDDLKEAKREREVSLDNEPEILGDTPDFFGGALREAQRVILLAAIKRLPPCERMAVELYYFGDEKGSGIGKVLGVSDKRARQLLHQGVRRLQTMLAHQNTLFV